ncbi:flagellar biosynthesis protein FlhB [Thioclava sp. DLFJ5-1]|uniref:flagellar biosynthesis protein FlhB n=1 Tax=Thioclava sp. DLFJ5-1 TaxID=1915314 RepID=UPI0009CC6AF8|nr:flagellar biosynthesis protein FlhB [Thioclava sp. DLFJ5-1]OOY22198.1 flagellar biosynthesis protein FlhB [Thioclava sp. DLFJ5-1]
MAEGDEQDKSSKTEEPTDKRLKSAREKGDVPSSRETGNMMSVFSLLMIVVFVLPVVAGRAMTSLGQVFAGAGQVKIGQGSAGARDIGDILSLLFGEIAGWAAPIFGVMLLAALFGVLIQGETVISSERMKPKLSKLSPLAGLKKMFSPGALVEFAKSITKVLVIGALALWVAKRAVTGIWQGENFLPEHIPSYAAHWASWLLSAAMVFLVPITIGDIIWKRFEWRRKLRMSLKEIRDEMKDSEGDPQIKGRRTEIARQRARQRMVQAVPTASVIVTNPTHYAVALKYEQGSDAAPVCVAKGADAVAARIRQIARENEVPIVENKPLARTLHATIDVDDTVPVEHWQAVAEIIGYVMDLRRNIRRAPPKGSVLRVDED